MNRPRANLSRTFDGVRRRLVLRVLPWGGAAMLAAVDAGAQTTPLPRVGYLTPGVPHRYERAFWDEMGRLGHVKDKTILVESRSAEGRFERLPSLAAELEALKVDVIVAVVTQASVAARDATRTTPVVMVGVADPVGAGLVSSLARPGANLTGTSIVAVEVIGKQLQLLRELMPHASRVAVLSNPANRVFQQQQWEQVHQAAARLSLQPVPVQAHRAEELDAAFAAIRSSGASALLVLADPMLSLQAGSIARLAEQHRLVAVAATRVFVEAGLVASYGPNFVDSFRRAAAYVDRILKGVRPADLAVEQSSTFELVVHRAAARRLGLAIPPAVVARADHVID